MKRIILLYNELIPSVRLCGYEQFTYLAEQGMISFDAIPLHNVTSNSLKDADAVVFVRGDSYFETYLAKKLRAAGKYLIYVLDDDLLNLPDYLASSAHYAQKHVRDCIFSLMNSCHCFLTPSQKLAEKYGKFFDKTILIEEPAMCSVRRKTNDGPVKIGFAGSVDRTLDFEQILATPLRNIKKRFGDAVEIEFLGIKPAIAEELNCKCHPYANDYAAYQNTMKSLDWDIGLAPMPDTAFHSCKHYNKFIEYGSYGIISVCSDLPPYTRVIQNWENGVLCPNEARAWEDALVKLVSEPSLRDSIAQQLYQQISGSFLIPQVSQKLWQQLDENIPTLKRHVMGSLLPCRLKMQLKMILPRIRWYGWRLPFVIVKKVIRKLFR